MSNQKAEVLAKSLESAVNATLHIAGTVSEGNRFRQAGDGKAHPAWLLGHLTNTMHALVNQWVLEGENMIPKGFGRKYAPDFLGGNPITTNPDDYFPWDETMALYKKIGDHCVGGVKQLNDADLPNPIKADMPDQMREIFSTLETTLIQAASHDAYHRGQMALLNKLPG